MTFFDEPINWDYVYEVLIVVYLSYYAIKFIITQIRTYKYVKAVKNTPTPYEFMFRASYELILAVVAVLVIPLAFLFSSSSTLFLIIPLATITFFSLFIHLEIYQFEGDRIKRFGENKSPIKATDVTGITIYSEEVNFHSVKYLNHLVFRSKRLRNKQWEEFTEAIEAFAERNNLPIEKA